MKINFATRALGREYAKKRSVSLTDAGKDAVQGKRWYCVIQVARLTEELPKLFDSANVISIKNKAGITKRAIIRPAVDIEQAMKNDIDQWRMKRKQA